MAAEAAPELTFDEKKTLDGLIRHAWAEDIQQQSVAAVAKAEGLTEEEVVKQQITVLSSASKNETNGPLHVLSSKIWTGHVVIDYSNPIDKVGAFAQAALSAKGVKAAVVYSGKNHAGVESAWLLAWADTKSLGRRVYGECGPKSKFSHINWEQIEHKLDHAGEVAKPHDQETGTGFYSTIVDTSNKDVVAAAFTG